MLQAYALLCTCCCRTTHNLQTALQHHAKFAPYAAGLCQVCIWCCRAVQDLQSVLQDPAKLAPYAAGPCMACIWCCSAMWDGQTVLTGPCRICIWCFRICTQHCRVAQGLHPESQDLHLVLQGHEGFAAMLQHAPCRPCTQHHTGPTALPQPCGPLLAPWGPPAPSTSPSTPQRRRLARCALASTLHRAAGGGGGTVGPGVSWPPPCAQDPPFHSYRKRRQRGPPVP